MRDVVIDARHKVWLWRAWTANRSRIADCGIARGATVEEATAVAWQALGGPHMSEVVEMQMEPVSSP